MVIKSLSITIIVWKDDVAYFLGLGKYVDGNEEIDRKTIEEMIKDSVRNCKPSELQLDDFDHLNTDLNLLIPYLKHTVSSKKQGVNILFYGPPGTGKTELTKTIAHTLETAIYEISYADEEDEPIEGDRRLTFYKKRPGV